jgi:heme exporter protein D
MNWAWDSFAEFLAMGGYGLYVWGSFGVTALVLAAELWSLRSRRTSIQSETQE